MSARLHIEALRNAMAQAGVDVYLVPTADFHESEYAGPHFGVRKFLSGFTGSAGTLVVTPEEAGLWTDGRYFIQAERQLEGSGILLYRMGTEGVPTLEEFILDKVPEGGVLGFDGRVVNSGMGEELAASLAKKSATISYEKDIVEAIWTDRPAISAEPAFLLAEKYCGKRSGVKLAELRQEMAAEGADTFILTSLDDIAWLFNIRGNDVPCNPVVMSYAIVTLDGGILFLNETVLNDEIREELQENNIQVRPYNDIYEYVKTLNPESYVLLQKSKVNYAIIRNLPEGVTILDRQNPTLLAKSMKNPIEVENLRRSHLKDGIAVTKFMYWLKQNVGKIPMTEMSAAQYLLERREEQEGFIEPSFNTIAAYNANAAMMHYSATPETMQS